MGSFGAPWWVAGGWAIDLAIGRQSRAHDDVEISVLYRDQEELRAALWSWELWVVDEGQLVPWHAGDELAMPRHQLWARRAATVPWSLEILFEVADEDHWVFRRDPRIRLPLDAFGTVGGGLPIVAPEVQLLFKAKEPREKDHHDFHAALGVLTPEAVSWLRTALLMSHPEHDWLTYM